MTQETGQPAPTDTEIAQAAPEANPATQPEPSEPQEVAATENAETKAEESSEERRKLSRSQRQQRKIARLSSMLAEQAAQLEQYKANSPQAPQPPKEEDFGGDYFAYNRALSKWDTEQIVNAAVSKLAPERPQVNAKEQAKVDLIEDLRERIAAVSSTIPDYQPTVESLRTAIGDLSDALLEEIGESDKGELILYHLGQNHRLAASLNRMSERDVAREIARLEAKVSLPQPKKQTAAPAPMTQPKGGAAPPRSITELTKGEDASDAIALWRQEKKRA